MANEKNVKRGRPAKFTVAKAAEIRKRYETGKYTLEELAGSYEASLPTVIDIVKGRRAYA